MFVIYKGKKRLNDDVWITSYRAIPALRLCQWDCVANPQ
jgi:hypothetical protein